jgi:hypothetical protein
MPKIHTLSDLRAVLGTVSSSQREEESGGKKRKKEDSPYGCYIYEVAS